MGEEWSWRKSVATSSSSSSTRCNWISWSSSSRWWRDGGSCNRRWKLSTGRGITDSIRKPSKGKETWVVICIDSRSTLWPLHHFAVDKLYNQDIEEMDGGYWTASKRWFNDSSTLSRRCQFFSTGLHGESYCSYNISGFQGNTFFHDWNQCFTWRVSWNFCGLQQSMWEESSCQGLTLCIWRWTWTTCQSQEQGRGGTDSKQKAHDLGKRQQQVSGLYSCMDEHVEQGHPGENFVEATTEALDRGQEGRWWPRSEGRT